MTNSPSTGRRVAGWSLLLLTVVLGLPLAAAAFLLAAAVRAGLVPSAVLALAATVLVCGPAARLGARLALRRRRRLAAALVTGGIVAVVVLGSALTVFRPLGVAAGPLPSQDTRYWGLSTGSRIAYTLTLGTGTRRPEPVVRLHGGPGTPGTGPDDLDRHLAAEGFDVYTYDQLGSGRSQRLDDPTGYTVARQVADLEAIRQRIGVPRLILVGGSWGATLAARYMAAHPGRTARAVFVSPGALWAPEWERSGEGEIWDRLTPAQRAAMDALEARPKLIAWSLLTEANPRAAHDLMPDEEIDPLFDRLLATVGSAATCRPGRPFAEPSSRSGFYANQMTSADALTVPDPRPVLRRDRTPALVLRGQCDYKRWEIAREYRDTLPGAKLLYVRGAGHVIEAEQPALHRDAITAFLTGGPLPLAPHTGYGLP
ncbi:alpha/beta fold hydrolase [Actinomadura rugatobispora]|uniref:Alpha/beta fold hydrolase n=1 Tax=Actinomadura rugatobispora TaxID=1994 RepID=A0ABW1A7K8_9ACTN